MIEWVNFPHVVAKAYSHYAKIECAGFQKPEFSTGFKESTSTWIIHDMCTATISG